MKFFTLFNLVYLSLIDVHNSIQNQLMEKIQEKWANGDYACLDLDDHYVIHVFRLNRSEVVIERYDKLKGITNSESISLNEHLDESLNLKDTIKQEIIQKLYSFEDTEAKYLCLSEVDNLYKNGIYLFDFFKSLPSHINLIENYDESKEEYLKYKAILRNSYLFNYYTYDKTFGYIDYFFEDYDKELFSLVLIGKGSKLCFFTFYLNSLDMTEYFRYYYTNKKGIPEEDVDTLLSFVKNFNFKLYEIDFNDEIIGIVSENFIESRNSMEHENIRLTRNIDLEINDHQMVWNSVCFSPTEEIECGKYFRISNYQLEEIKKFNSDINKVNLQDLEKINGLIILLKGTELYRKILENILNNQDSGKGLILINILYSLAIITKSQFEDFLYNRSTKNICINDIIKQINSHCASVRFCLYNMLLYSELENIANSQNDDVSFFRDFSQIISISSVKKLMGSSNIDHLTILEKLYVFIERVYFKPNLRTLKFNSEDLDTIYSFVCGLLKYRLIVDDNLGLLNTKDHFEEDFIQKIYDQILTKNQNN